MTRTDTQLNPNDLPPIYFSRPPRIQPVIEEEEVVVPAPPNLQEIDTVQTNLWLRLLPSLFMLVPTLAFTLAFFAGTSNSGQITIRLFAIGAMVISVIFATILSGRGNKDKDKRNLQNNKHLSENYDANIENLENEILAKQQSIYSILRRLHKTPEELIKIFETPSLENEQERLWERRPDDMDFLLLRIGSAKQRSGIHIDNSSIQDWTDADTSNQRSPKKTKEADVSASPAYKIGAAIRKARSFEAEYGWIRHAPLLVDLRKHASVSVIGKALAPEGQAARGDVLRSVLLQIALHHAPNNVSIYAVLDPVSSSPESGTPHNPWTWLARLPHCSPDLMGNFAETPETEQIAYSSDKMKQVLDYLYEVLKRRREEIEEGGSLSRETPHVVLLVDNWLVQEIREHPVFPLIFASGTQLKISALFNGERLQDIPDLSSVIIRMDIPTVQIWYGETGEGGQRIPDAGWDTRDTRKPDQSLPDPKYSTVQLWENDPRWKEVTDSYQADRCSELELNKIAWIGKIQLMVSGGQTMLPSYVSFFDLHSVDSVRSLGIEQRWKNLRVLSASNAQDDLKKWWSTLPRPVTVGLFDRRTPFMIGLSQTLDGPHGLLAGTTGSGKSEFLQTLICALAIEHDPRFLSFFLIDYKGGIAFKTFEKLPHVVGNISDLSPSQAQRGLIALRGEVERRKRIFASVTTSRVTDIASYHTEYDAYLERYTKIPQPEQSRLTPVPYLIIIVDEFAELKTRFPDFINEVTSIARVGRALGIHLLMATQRPQGSINDDIRSNTNYSISLRVQNPVDSTDMIGIRDAAYLPPIYGRGYFQASGNPPRLFQGGYVGAPLEQGTRNTNTQGFVIRWTKSTNWDMNSSSSYRYVPTKQTQDSQDARDTAAEDSTARNIAEGIVNHILDIVRQMEDRDGPDQDVKLVKKIILPPLPDEIPLEYLLYLKYKDTSLGDQERDQTESLKTRQWRTQDWLDNRSPEAVFGKSDRPFEQEAENRQPLEFIDFQVNGESVMIYGSSGSGKSTAIMSMTVSLMQSTDPNRLHIAVIDCGSVSSLEPLRGFPHVGTYVTPTQTAEIRSLMNWVSREFRRRREKAEGKAFTEQTHPLFVLVVDNFAEFRQVVSVGADGRENFDVAEINIIEQIAQYGKNLGMYLILSGGERYADIPAGITRAIRNRLIFNMTNPDETRLILEPSLKFFPTQPGSANWRRIPDSSVQVTVANVGNTSISKSSVTAMVNAMTVAYDGMTKAKPPFKARRLPTRLSYKDLETRFLDRSAEHYDEQDALVLHEGVFTACCALRNDLLSPWVIKSGRSSPHILVVGAADSGKTTTIDGVLRSAHTLYQQDQGETSEKLRVLIMTDEDNSPKDKLTLRESPVSRLVDERSAYSKADFARALQAINDEIAKRKNGDIPGPLVCVLENVHNPNLKLTDLWATDAGELVNLVQFHVHLIVSVRLTTTLPTIAKNIRENGGTLCVTSPANPSSYSALQLDNTALNKLRRLDPFENRGRAFVLDNNQLEIVQIAHT